MFDENIMSDENNIQFLAAVLQIKLQRAMSKLKSRGKFFKRVLYDLCNTILMLDLSFR